MTACDGQAKANKHINGIRHVAWEYVINVIRQLPSANDG